MTALSDHGHSLSQIEAVMDAMHCTGLTAVKILDAMDDFGYPDWSEISTEQLRSFCKDVLISLGEDEG
jgi:hypothetical protein